MKTYKDIELQRLNSRFDTLMNSLQMLKDDYIRLVNRSEEDIKRGL